MSGSSLGIAFVKTFSSHYPERLGAIQLIDPPGVFQVLLKAVGAVMDERTASKLASVTGSTHAERMGVLEARIGAGGHMEWLRTVLDTPVGTALPGIPEGYFAVADTTHAADIPLTSAGDSGGAGAAGGGHPLGPVLGMPQWTAGIKEPPSQMQRNPDIDSSTTGSEAALEPPPQHAQHPPVEAKPTC